MGMLQLSFFGTNIEKASHLPSGDHSTPDGVSFSRVSCEIAPSASIHFTNSCVPAGSPFAMYATREPSGDHRGFEPLTRKRFFVPSAFMIHSDVCHWSFILSTQRRP